MAGTGFLAGAFAGGGVGFLAKTFFKGFGGMECLATGFLAIGFESFLGDGFLTADLAGLSGAFFEACFFGACLAPFVLVLGFLLTFSTPPVL